MLNDFKYGLRSLLKHPGFTVIAVLTLGLGIGVNTAIFSVVNTVLLRALPFPSPERLVSVGKSATSQGLPGLAAYEYLAWREKATDFEDIAAHSNSNYNLSGLGEPERVQTGKVTASFFTTLGVAPVRGRVFFEEEDKPGGNPVAVISDAFWQRRYGRNDSAIGSILTLNNKNHTIVGVMPASFRFPNEFDIWVPLALDPVRETQGDWFSLIEVVGRIKPGANVERAQTELSVLSRQASQHFKEIPEASTLEILPLHQFLVAGVRRTVFVLWGAVGLVMLIACVNVASLMLSRTVSRQREMAVRAAVGARRWQLIRQLLVESVLLGLVGGGLGVLVAIWCRSVIASLVPEGLTSSIHDLGSSNMDWRVFGFTLGLSLVTGLIFGLVPSFSASKPNLIKTLRENNPSNLIGFGLRSIRGWLVVAELALAMVLLLAAGLLVRSFNQLLAVDLGFDRENVLTVRVDLPRSSYAKPEQAGAFHEQLLERVKALPGVQSAAEVSHKPLAGFSMIVFTEIEGIPKLERPKDKPVAAGVVSSDYFQTLKIPIVFGRYNDERDRKGAAEVAIVNQAFARRFFGDADPTGRRLSFGCEESLCRTIVGVVGNIRQESLTDEVYPEIYVPAGQMPLNGMTLLVRSSSDPTNLVSSIRHTVFSLDKNQPVYDVKTLEQRVNETIAISRSLMLLFAGFAVLAVVLAAVGIYGIVSYSVSQRTREIGIRMALGARRGDVLKLVMRNGVSLAVVGIAFGIGGAYALTRFLTTLLFGIKPTDITTFVIVSVSLFIIAIAACLIPARRATKVDPLMALRCD